MSTMETDFLSIKGNEVFQEIVISRVSCSSMFSVQFCFLDNNPSYGKKLMLKDKCDRGISRHVR